MANGKVGEMTADEQAVIEAAVEWDNLRTSHELGMPVSKGVLDRSERDLAWAVARLHAETDGRWEPRDG